jgi:hypothetical protein
MFIGFGFAGVAGVVGNGRGRLTVAISFAQAVVTRARQLPVVVNTAMRYREIIAESISIPPAEIAVAIRQAASDLWHDWLQIVDGEEGDEPEPRASILLAAKAAYVSDEQEFTQFALPLLASEAQRFITALPWHNGRLTIYRNIAVPSGWELDPTKARPLGVFWALDDHFTHIPHISGGAETLLHTITSQAVPTQVKWSTVILKHLTYTENEIRLRDHAKVPILGVKVWSGGAARNLNINHLKGHLFDVGERGNDWLD